MIYLFFPVHECLVCIPDGFLLLLWQQERWPGCRGFSLVQFSPSVMSDSWWLHGLQHARLPCLSPTPGTCSNSCQSSRWCHPTISSSVFPFSSHLQSFPASGSFPMSQFFASGGQSIAASPLASVLSMNIQDWFPSQLTGLISLQSKGTFKSLLQHHSSKALVLWHSPLWATSHIHTWFWKNHRFDYMDLCW